MSGEAAKGKMPVHHSASSPGSESESCEQGMLGDGAELGQPGGDGRVSKRVGALRPGREVQHSRRGGTRGSMRQCNRHPLEMQTGLSLGDPCAGEKLSP